MKNRILLTVLCTCIFTAAFAQPKKVVADKIVAVVGNKIVLKSDIDNNLLDMQRQGMELPPDARFLTMEQSMGIKALVLQAEKDSLPVTDEEVEANIDNQIRYFISQYGSKEELEKRLKKYAKSMGFELENQRFYQYLRLNIDFDSFFILNFLNKEEVIEIIDDKKAINELSILLSDIVDEKLTSTPPYPPLSKN